MTDKIVKSEAQWREALTEEQYHVCRERGTERAFSGAYWDTKTAGVYRCTACGEPLFSSQAKFDSGTGWPSFYEAVSEGAVELHEDTSHGLVRTEVTCAKCGGHLGHVFDDGPSDTTGKRYCINSCSLDFKKEKEKVG